MLRMTVMKRAGSLFRGCRGGLFAGLGGDVFAGHGGGMLAGRGVGMLAGRGVGMLAVMLVIGGAAGSADVAGQTLGAPEADRTTGTSVLQAPEPWLQEDPGSRTYSQAREALNAGRYREAAEAFQRLRSDHPRSGYVADSHYWQAFALSRLGSRSQLREAQALLRTQMDEYPGAGTHADARDLYVRVESQLAQQGDARAAAAITQQASDPCGPDQEVRAAALNALLNMNPERALPILKQVLQEKDACSAELREQAVFLIAQNMDDEAVDILLDLAHRNPDPNPEVREAAVFWLSQVQVPEAMEALRAILRESDDREVQEKAVFAIAQFEGEESVEILRSYAEREDLPAELRENVIFWLGQKRGGGEYLRSLWNRVQDPELKESILFGVAQQDTQESRAWLVERAMDPSEDTEVRENAIFWAGQSGAFSLQELRELFQVFQDPELKEQVIFVASQRGDSEAVDFLMEVAEDAENGEVREQAIFWLGQSDDPRVPEFLLRIIGR